jgi:hypothetical protein
MKKNALKGVIALALASISSLACADDPKPKLSFLEQATFKVDGGKLIVDLYTLDTVKEGPTKYTLNALSGEFLEYGNSTPFTNITLLFPSQQYGNNSKAGNTPTDNSWLSPGSFNPHLTTGGFAFSYSSDPNDKYQVYYADDQYQGCWGQGGCIKLQLPTIHYTAFYSFPIVQTPEPEEWAMMLLGAGMVGFQVKRKKKQLGLGS